MRYTNTGARIWEPEEDEILMMKYPDTLNSELVKELDRTKQSIYARAQILGLKKSKAYIAQHGMRFTRDTCKVGEPYRWKKGNKPPNAGKKLEGKRLEQLLSTAFKKGNIPHNTYPEDGVIKIRHDKNANSYYQYIRVSVGKWKPLHVLIWENKHGGYNQLTHCLWFINGNTLDVRLDNLELITRAENVSRNRTAYLTSDPELLQAKKTIQKLNKTIKKHEEQTKRP